MKPVRGVTLILFAVSFFSVTSGLVKVLERMPAGEIVFFRSIGAIPVLLIWLWLRGSLRKGLHTKKPVSHFVRSIAGTLSMGLGFAALKFLPLPEVTALRFILPILVVILAALFLGETIRLTRTVAVITGLVGVLIILAPRLGAGLQGAGHRELVGAALVLGASALSAIAQIFIKRMSETEHTAAIVFYFALTSTILSLASMPFGWVWPNGQELALVAAIGLLGGIGQILLTNSYRFADASALAPFTYFSMLWALFIGYVFFDEVPTLLMLFGAGVVIASGLAIVLRERQLARRITSG